MADRSPPTAAGRPGRPDVYFLVLDAYGRSDVLREVYGFDNSAFLDRLERKGFFVARRSTSNYCQTALSLAATLNLRYLDDLAGSRSPSRLPLRDLIRDNAVFRAFRAQGYRIVAFATGFDATELTGADLYLGPAGNLGAFHALLADADPALAPAGPAGRPRARTGCTASGSSNVFDRLPEVAADRRRPTFCFAHVLAPHPPFVFGADGRDTSGREATYSLGDSEAWRRSTGHGGPGGLRGPLPRAGRLHHRPGRARPSTGSSATSPDAADHHHPGRPRPRLAFRLRRRTGPTTSASGWASSTPLPARRRPGAARRRDHAGQHVPGRPRPLLRRRSSGRLPDRNYYSPYHTPYVFTDVTGELAEAVAAG